MDFDPENIVADQQWRGVETARFRLPDHGRSAGGRRAERYVAGRKSHAADFRAIQIKCGAIAQVVGSNQDHTAGIVRELEVSAKVKGGAASHDGRLDRRRISGGVRSVTKQSAA